MPVLTRSMTKYINDGLDGILLDAIHRYCRWTGEHTERDIQYTTHIHRMWDRAEAVNYHIWNHSLIGVDRKHITTLCCFNICQSVNMKVYIYSVAEREMCCRFKRLRGDDDWMFPNGDAYIAPDLVDHVEKENKMMIYVNRHGWVKC